MVCAASDEAATESACNSQRQIYRRNKLSTQFTNIGVQKSVSAQRLIGLDRFTWIIDKFGTLQRIHTHVSTRVQFQFKENDNNIF